ncbi:MAG: aldehyde ferredoxin oxidoreductase family protein [Candidatus Heimdallarchaeota archaeon]
MTQFISSQVLFINLSKRSFHVDDRSDLFTKYLGGTGVGIQLLLEKCKPNADPLGPENVIVFAVGPLTGLFPMASKTVALFKSPLTGNLGESHAGGRSAVAIRSAGYGAIVIEGSSETPIYLSIDEKIARFREGATFWGMRSTHTIGRIIRERESGAGIRTIMRVGRAGEMCVSYANVITETYRHFGRLGLGAVFGSKKLEAIVVQGKRIAPVSDRKYYRKIYDELYDKEVNSTLLNKYHDFGTSVNILVLNEIGGLPTKNLQAARFGESAENISGEYLAEHYLGRRVACAHCPVACIHLAVHREPYEDEAFFYKTTWVSYDYELLYALGSMLGIADAQGVLKLINEVEVQGLDAMSTGVVLAYATELQEKGLITPEETLGLELKWGDFETYLQAIKHIVLQKNEFYQALARGVDYAAEKYSGSDFALAFGKNEMPGYHTGIASYVNFLTGARHSHLDSAGYSLDQKILKISEKSQPTPQMIAESLYEEEVWRQILSSLVVCFFARGIYDPETVIKTLKAVDYDFSVEQLIDIGRDILKVKYQFKLRDGFSPEDLRIPQRIFETKTPIGPFEESKIQESMKAYFKKVGIV